MFQEEKEFRRGKLESAVVRSAASDLGRAQSMRLGGLVEPGSWETHRLVWARDVVRKLTSFEARWS